MEVRRPALGPFPLTLGALGLFAFVGFGGCATGDDDAPAASGGTAGRGGQAGKGGRGQAGSSSGRSGEAGAPLGGEGGEAGARATGGAVGKAGSSGGPESGHGGVGGRGSGGTGAGGSGGRGFAGSSNAGVGGTAGSGQGGEAPDVGGEGGGQQGGHGGGGSGPCGGPAPCECLKVAPDGDDAGALAASGATEFATVQAALAFAAGNLGAPRDICVASGPACGASATFDFGGYIELVDGVGVYGRYESTGFSRCDASVTELSGPQPYPRVVAESLALGATLDGFSVDATIEVKDSRVVMNDLVANGASFNGAVASRLTNSTIRATSGRSLHVTESELEVSNNSLGSAWIEDDDGGTRLTDNAIDSDATALIVFGDIGVLSGNTIHATDLGIQLQGCEVELVDNRIEARTGVWIEGCGSPTVLRSNEIVARSSNAGTGVVGMRVTLVGNDISAVYERDISNHSFDLVAAVDCRGCDIIENRIEAEGSRSWGVFAAGSIERNFITGGLAVDSGTVRNNHVRGRVRILDGALQLEHNTIFGTLFFEGEGATIVGNIVQAYPPLQHDPGTVNRPPWVWLANNDLVTGSGESLYEAGSFTVTTIAQLQAPLSNLHASGNLALDPQFAALGRLGPGSPCIDAGFPAGPGDTDIDGDQRTGNRDIGADEFGGAPPCGGATCSGAGDGVCTEVGDGPRCLCAPGFTNPPGDPMRCEPDECWLDNGGCYDFTRCENTFPGRTCSACPPGFSGTGETLCLDIDECLTDHGGCDPLRACVNTWGGRTCGPCPGGYYTVGETGCQDVDECQGHPFSGRCDPLTTCTNVPGGWSCGDCPSGYLGDGATGCYLDQCTGDNGGCDPLVTCTSTPGGPSCGPCPPGYAGTGASGCYGDVCAVDNGGCDPLVTCVSTPSGADCGACPLGYVGSGDAGCTPDVSPFVQVTAGSAHSCGLRQNGAVQCWGYQPFYYSTPPVGETFLAVSAGAEHTIAIRTDGTLVFWGNDQNDLGMPPSGAFASVSAGYAHDCATRTDGTLSCWGWNGWGQTNAPPDAVSAVDVGTTNTCVLRLDGSIGCFGSNDVGESVPPPGVFQQLTMHGIFGCGLRADGSVECWGYSSLQGWQPTHPGPFREVQGTGNGFTACGLKLDDTLLCWGTPTAGLTSPPGGTFTAFGMGLSHGCAVRSDGTVACWGSDGDGQASPPP
jgi:hypothetical protein